MNNSYASEKIEYLINNTDGVERYILDPQGFNSLHNKVLEQESSYYVIQYKSSLDGGFGRKYIPVKLEAYLNTRTGKDELGYFSPLKF